MTRFATAALLLAACTGTLAYDPDDRAQVANRINTTIPARMVAHLDFTPQTLRNGVRPLEVDVIAPTGWRSSVPDDRFAAWLSPPPGVRLLLRNSFAVGVDCAGACEPKDWPAVIDAELRHEIPDDGLLGDQPLPDGGRVRWGKQGKDAAAYAAWALPGDNHFRRCVVRLLGSALPDADVVDAIGVFAEACKTARFRSGPAATPRSGT